MGCGCNLEYLKGGFTGKDLLQDQSLRDALSRFKMINGKAFRNGDTLAMMQYASCLDSVQFYGMFKNIGLDIGPSDLEDFAGLVSQGADKAGKMLNDQDKPVFFDAVDMIRNMKFTPEQIQRSSCQIEFIE